VLQSWVHKKETRSHPPPSPYAGLWRERFTTVCRPCILARRVCLHHPELPLRCLLVGHNPSEHAFASGYFYSNPTNRAWRLLTGTLDASDDSRKPSLVPRGWPLQRQDILPGALGIGLTDLGVEAGNDAASYPAATLARWRDDLYASLAGHVSRVQGTLATVWDIAHAPPPAASAGSAGGGASPSAPMVVGAKRPRPAAATGGGAADDGVPVDTTAATSDCVEWLRHARSPDAAPESLAGPAGAAALVAAVVAMTPTLAAVSGSGVALDRAGFAARSVAAPRIVAFTGKAQWKCLFTPHLT
jgi:hypothetical protein